MMSRKLKADWLRALRSGEYEQGKGALEKQYPDGRVQNCCLGVLCRVANVPSRLVEPSMLNYRCVEFIDGETRSCDFPPDRVRECLGGMLMYFLPVGEP